MTHNKVDFFIVGAARSGTTTLWQWLKGHSDIFLPETKEPHYFCFKDKGLQYFGNELDPHYKELITVSEKDYLHLYNKCKPHQLNGDASPGYLYFPGTAANIKQHNPSAKIICILRNPCDRAFSQFIFHVQAGFEDVCDFQTALNNEEARISKGWWWGHHYLKAGNYVSQWQEYCDEFDESQRLLLFYDDLVSSPKATYEKICDFLNIVPSTSANVNLHVNGTSDLVSVPLNLKIHRLLTHGVTSNKHLMNWLPKWFSQKIKQFIIAINKQPKPEMTSSSRNFMANYYRPELERLSSLTGVDLSNWFKNSNNLKMPPNQQASRKFR